MFDEAMAGSGTPKSLSLDNDPLFEFGRWKSNLRILEIDEIKTIPYTPISHPFVERIIGTIRREYLDHTLFFNERDLQRKLDDYKVYYNEVRAHSSLDMKPPTAMDEEVVKKVVSLDEYRWKLH